MNQLLHTPEGVRESYKYQCEDKIILECPHKTDLRDK